jgi:hypothetical protein
MTLAIGQKRQLSGSYLEVLSLELKVRFEALGMTLIHPSISPGGLPA